MLIDTPAELSDVVDRLRGEARVAVDTEFFWERTFYPRLGLVQLGTAAGETFLVDPLALDLAPLGRLMADPNVQKVLHDAGQDLTILRRATGVVAENILDTRLASGFAGLSSTLSLRRVLVETVGVSLAKTESRSDWLRRPLSDAQIAYAHDDVRYLVPAAEELLRRIEAAGRLAWLSEELAVLDVPDTTGESDPETAYARLKGQGRLHPKERAVLKRLAAWREHEARTRDQPRGHVVSDDALVAVAQRKVQDASGAERAGVPKRHIAAVIEAVKAGLNDEPIRVAEPPPEDETLGARVDLLFAFVKGRGVADGVDPALVANRADIVALAADRAPSAETHEILAGWRGVFVGADLVRLLRGEIRLRLDPERGLPVVEEA